MEQQYFIQGKLRISSIIFSLLFNIAFHAARADDYSNQVSDSDAAEVQLRVSNWDSSVVVQEAIDGSGAVCLPSVSFKLHNLGTDISGMVVSVDFLDMAAQSVFSSSNYVIDSIPSGFSKDIEIDAPQGAGLVAGNCASLPPLTARVTVQKTIIAEGEINPEFPGESPQPAQPSAPPSTPPAPSSADTIDPAAIQRKIMPCWPFDAGAPGVASFSVHLLLDTDASGTVRSAEVAPEDQKKMSDPTFSNFANEAITMVTNYQCSPLPLPSSLLGQPQELELLFSPNN